VIDTDNERMDDTDSEIDPAPDNLGPLVPPKQNRLSLLLLVCCMGLLIALIAVIAINSGQPIDTEVPQREIEAQRIEIELVREQLTKSGDELEEAHALADQLLSEKATSADEALRLHRALDARDQAIEEMRSGYEEVIEQKKDELNRVRAEFEHYQDTYRMEARAAAPGTNLGDVAYQDLVFRDVIIRQVTPAGIDVTHSRGVAHLKFDQLPRFLRNRYAYDSDAGQAYLSDNHRAIVSAQIARDQAALTQVARKEAINRQIERKHLEQKIHDAQDKLTYAKNSLDFTRQRRGTDRRSLVDYDKKISELETEINEGSATLKRLRARHSMLLDADH